VSQFERVVGLDLSLTSTGIAVNPLDGRIDVQKIKSTGKKTDSWAQRLTRIQDIARRVEFQVGRDALVILEAPSYGSSTGSQHDRSGLWWEVFLRLATSGSTVVPVEPTKVKKFATGKGNADKDKVLAEVVRRYPDIDVDGNDTADAVALLDIGMHLLGQPLTHVPALNRTVLDGITIPDRVVAA